jgi:crossover junction endodeoxyribonuclease RuvC
LNNNASASDVRVLGVDPGSRFTGWGLLGGSANVPRLIDFGVIRPDRRAVFPERLSCLYTEMEALVRRLEPTRSV